MSTLRLGRVLGIPVEIHWSILAVVALFTGNLAIRALPIYAPGTELKWRLVAALVGVILFFASILAHELGHSLVALGHGVGVSSITLWLLGGMAELDRMVPTARAEARIAAAGPAVSGILAVFFSATAVISFELGAWRLFVAVAVWLGFVNLTLAVFNLAPAAPLDGGRILTAALWRRMGDAERARVLAGRCGLVLSVLLVLGGAVQLMTVGMLEGWVMAAVGLFVFQAARAEIRSAVVRGRLRATPAATLAVAHPPSLPDSTSVLQLGQWAGDGAGRHTAFPVVRWGLDPVGYVVPGALASIPAAQQSWTRVGQVMVRSEDVDRIEVGATAEEVLARWDGDRSRIAVLHRGHDPAPTATLTFAQLAPMLAWPDLWGRDRNRAEPGVRTDGGGPAG